jgi:hypothetical protein
MRTRGMRVYDRGKEWKTQEYSGDVEGDADAIHVKDGRQATAMQQHGQMPDGTVSCILSLTSAAPRFKVAMYRDPFKVSTSPWQHVNGNDMHFIWIMVDNTT